MPKRLAVVLITLLALFAWVWPAGAAEGKKENTALILEALDLISEYHISNPETVALTEGAIRGMLEGLDDPYAEYLDPEALQGFTDALNGDLIGVGVELITRDGYPLVVGVLPGTPAERGGLMRGDLILAVDGRDTYGRPLGEVAMEIRGPRGSQVVLTIKRGNSEFDVTLLRADVHVPSVYNEMLAGNTGYVAVSSFGGRTTGEFETALRNLRERGMARLIIDLRGNGGGYLHEAVDMLDNFLPRGALVVTTVDNRGFTNEVRTSTQPTVTGLPMVVLTDLGSASAAEIMAGALRDHGLADLVGGTTYGKGVVQTVFPLSSGGALKLTVAKYMTPAGTDINLTGLRPNHQVITPALQKEVAWQLLNPGDGPDLVFAPGGEARLNGRETGLVIDVLERGGRKYLPLRPVLEAMLYQVYWEGDRIRVLGGSGEKTVYPIAGGHNGAPAVIVEKGVSYLAVDLFRQLNINVNNDEKVYKLERRL